MAEYWAQQPAAPHIAGARAAQLASTSHTTGGGGGGGGGGVRAACASLERHEREAFSRVFGPRWLWVVCWLERAGLNVLPMVWLPVLPLCVIVFYGPADGCCCQGTSGHCCGQTWSALGLAPGQLSFSTLRAHLGPAAGGRGGRLALDPDGDGFAALHRAHTCAYAPRILLRAAIACRAPSPPLPSSRGRTARRSVPRGALSPMQEYVPCTKQSGCRAAGSNSGRRR